MEGFVIASQYLISKRRMDFSEVAVLSALTRLLIPVAIIRITFGGLQAAADSNSAGSTHDATIADTRLMQKSASPPMAAPATLLLDSL